MARLEASLKWEVRSIALVPLVGLVYKVSKPLGFVLGGVVALAVLATDTTFSILVCWVFLQPILQALKRGKDVAAVRESDGFKTMRAMEYSTMIGASMAVASSTMLYVMDILCFAMEGIFWSNPWLNFGLLPACLGAILNNVGVVVLSGMLRDTAAALKTPGRFRSRKKTVKRKEPNKISYVGQSHASTSAE